MNRNWLLLIFLLGSGLTMQARAQKGFLYLRKHYKRIRVYTEGEPIRLEMAHEVILEERILRLRNDSIFFRNYAFPVSQITRIYKLQTSRVAFPVSGGQLALITAGVALSTLGMTASGWETFDHALIYSATIGYAPLVLIYGFNKLKPRRTQYRIGKKFNLQEMDFYSIPRSN